MVYLVCMVAGLSSRFGGFPKSIAIVGPNNETLIEYSINQAVKTGYLEKIIFITNELTEHYFVKIFSNSYKNIPIQYVRQQFDKSIRIRPWGTADAVTSLYSIVDKPFILINGDDIYGEDTFSKGFKLFNEYNDNIIGGLQLIDTLPKNGIVNRGVIYLEKDNMSVIDMREMYNISRSDTELYNHTANVNFIGLMPNTLKLLHQKVEKFKENNKNDSKIECILTNLLGDMICNKEIKMIFFNITTEILGITNVGDDVILKNRLALSL